MSDWAPLARIVLRYIIGGVLGMEAGALLAGDPDVVFYVALGIGAVVEVLYAYAKRKGWAT
jgi:hypothetical protein